MKLFFKALFAIFIGLSSIKAQELEKTKPDSTQIINISAVKSIQVNHIEDLKINNWQLYKNTVYESYPDSVSGNTDFIKG
jgi:hypothetical protein